MFSFKQVAAVAGLGMLAAYGGNGAFAHATDNPITESLVSTDVSGALYLGHASSAALPSIGAAWNGSWGQTYVGDQAAINKALADVSDMGFDTQTTADKIILFPWRRYDVKTPDVLTNVAPLPEPTTLIAGSLLLLPIAASAFRSRGQRVKMAKRMA